MSSGRLPHVLRPASYYEPAIYEREVERLFRPGWHFVATRADLARHGDFVTADLFGHPVLVRNDHGTVHAYLNVCAHRHALLTNVPAGRSEVLRCQYHGWEYDADGAVCRAREAECFRPVVKGAERLTKLRTASCAELVFVSLANDGATLEEHLGPRTCDFVRGAFSSDFVQAGAWRVEHAANWKIPIENSLESYHTPIVHPGTFGTMPARDEVRHTLERELTIHEDCEPRRSLRYRLFMRTLRDAPDCTYVHLHRFPNLTLVETDISSYLQSVVPTSPTTSVSHVRSFVYRGDSRGPVRRAIVRALRKPIARFVERVLREDRPIFDDVQRGIRASAQPGVLSAREERIFAFQTWVAHEIDGTPPDPRALGTSSYA